MSENRRTRQFPAALPPHQERSFVAGLIKSTPEDRAGCVHFTCAFRVIRPIGSRRPPKVLVMEPIDAWQFTTLPGSVVAQLRDSGAS